MYFMDFIQNALLIYCTIFITKIYLKQKDE